MSSSSDPDRFVTLMCAKSRVEAQLVQNLLESAGIVTFVPGTHLVDEFAGAGSIMNTVGTEVRVAAENVERAREILAAARGQGETLDDEGTEPGS